MDWNTKRRASTRGRRAVGGLLLVGASALLSACSSGPPAPAVASLGGQSAGGSTASQAGSFTVAQSDRDMVLFAQCLRAHGINEADPRHRPGHSGLSIDIPGPSAVNTPALAACNHFIAKDIAAKEAGARTQLAHWLPALTHYAQCMRSHDIPMLDPGPQGELNLGNVPGITGDFGRYSPQFRSADSACRHLLPAGVKDDGTGP
jgi:hypothetical protein